MIKKKLVFVKFVKLLHVYTFILYKELIAFLNLRCNEKIIIK